MTITYQIGGPSPFPIIKDFRTDPRTAWAPYPRVNNQWVEKTVAGEKVG